VEFEFSVLSVVRYLGLLLGVSNVVSSHSSCVPTGHHELV